MEILSIYTTPTTLDEPVAVFTTEEDYIEFHVYAVLYGRLDEQDDITFDFELIKDGSEHVSNLLVSETAKAAFSLGFTINDEELATATIRGQMKLNDLPEQGTIRVTATSGTGSSCETKMIVFRGA